MRHCSPVLVSVLALGALDAQNAPADTVDDLSEMLERHRKAAGVPSLVAAVVVGDAIRAVGATGTRRADRPGAVAAGDAFHLGSVTKPMTSSLVARLVETGELSWSLSMKAAFPEVEDLHGDLADVTVADLLTHRGGIQPFEEDEELAELPEFSGSHRDQRYQFARYLLTRRPFSTVGEHAYSNAGYAIVAAVVERELDRSWESLMRERLFEPLRMSTAATGWPVTVDEAAPWGHQRIGGSYRPHDPNDGYEAGALLGPAGDVHCSIVDLARFARLHLRGLQGHDGALLSTTVRHLHTPRGDYGLGWNIRGFGSTHVGSLDRFFAGVVVAPARNLAVVFATNGVPPDESAFGSAIASELFRAYGRAPKRAARDGSPR